MARIGGIAYGAGAALAVVAGAIGVFGILSVRDDGSEPAASVAAVQTDLSATTAGSGADDAAKAVVPGAEISEAAPTDPQKTPALPDFDVVRIDAEGSALVAGHAAPDQDVTLRLDGDAVATVKADAQGNFVSFFTVPTSEVPQVLSLETADPDGQVVASEGNVIVAPVVPAADVEVAALTPEAAQSPPEADAPAPSIGAEVQAPEAPSVASPAALVAPAAAETVETASAAPRLLRTGPDGLEVIQGGDGAPDVRTDLGIDAISYNAQGDVQLAGRADEAADLRIYVDNEPVRDIRADASGAWTSQLPDFPPGVYTLRVDAVLEDGAVASRIETPFERAAPDVAAALSGETGAITVQPGFTLWAISETYFGAGPQYVQIFDANRELIRDPNLIYPGQVFTLPEPG